MQNLAGNPEATKFCTTELEAAGIPVAALDDPHGEVPSTVGGPLGPFSFRRAWVYWVAEGTMSAEHARAIDNAPRESEQETKYSGGRQTWGAVVRVDGFAGGGASIRGDIDLWHIDTPDGLKFFADKVRELGLVPAAA